MPEAVTPNVDMRALVEENLKLSKEMHKMVRSMRRSMLIQRFFSFLWVVLIVGPLILSYFYFQPFIKQYGSMLQMMTKPGGMASLIQGGGDRGSGGAGSAISPDMIKGLNLEGVDLKTLMPMVENMMKNQQK